MAFVLRPAIRLSLSSYTEQTIRAAHEALDEGDIPCALAQAQSALKKSQKSHRSIGASHFVLGLVRERQAEQGASSNPLVYYAAAIHHFVAAGKAGVAPEDRPRLSFHLGKCLYARGQTAESLSLLSESLVDYPQGRAYALHLLTQAYMDPSQPDWVQAYQRNLELILTPGITKQQLERAWQIRRDLLQYFGYSDPLRDIDLSEYSADVKWVSPLIQACESLVGRQFDSAIRSLEIFLRMKGLPQPIERRAWFLLGLAAKENGDFATALATFRQQVEWRYPNSAEAHDAATLSASILLSQGKLTEAVSVLARAAKQAATNNGIESVPVAGPSLAQVIRSAMDQILESCQFETAVELLDSYRSVVDTATADQAAAELHEAWAAAKLEEARSLKPEEAVQATYRAEELYRAAGTYLVRAADAAQSPERTAKTLWRAANDFIWGRSYLVAVNTLERLVATGIEGDLRAQALALTCASLEACGKPELVFQVAETCIQEFPQHPAAHTARYYLARCQIGFGQTDQAEINLVAILGATGSEAPSNVVQQARLMLAYLYHDQGREDDAIRPLGDMLSEDADPDISIEARLLLTDCLRQRARRPAGRFAESRSEQAKSHYRVRKEQALEQALQLLSKLERELAARERADQLSPKQWEWLRLSRRGIAECLYEVDRVGEAMEMFKRLAETYTAPGYWLETQIQIANCHERMNQFESARALLRAAQERLEQQPADAMEEARTTMAPERWKEWLDWTRRL